MPTILITGASRGIGFELVRLCLERGYRVLATHRPGPEAPRPLVDLAAGHPGRIRLIPIDLTNLPALANRSSRLAERIDVLINSAGVVVDMRSEADGSGRVFYEHSLRGGSVSPLRVVGAALSNMTRGAKIATISAVLGYTSSAGDERAQAGVRNSVDEIMRGLATDLKPLGIAVAIVQPVPPQADASPAKAEKLAAAAASGVLAVIDRLDLAHSGEVFVLDENGR